jgi:hypothetical protein
VEFTEKVTHVVSREVCNALFCCQLCLYCPVKLHQGNIRGQHWDLSLNQGQSNDGGRAHNGWDLMCNLSVGGQMVCQGGRDQDDHLT